MGILFNKSQPVTKVTQRTLDIEAVCAVLQHFPIGTTVDYYPEFKKAIVLETVIIGYMINKTPFFSAQDVIFEGEGADMRLLIGEGRQATPLSSLSFIIPMESRGMGQLDYTRREELDRVGGLAKGNNITLMAQVDQGKTPLVQTTVARNTQFKEGPFANTIISLLDIEVTSLLLIDQRAKVRLQINLPAHVSAGKGDPISCIMADFSDRSVRLWCETGWPAGIITGMRLKLAFRLPGRNADTVLRGEFYRVDYNDLVLMLEGIERDGQFRSMEMIDLLEIKSKLLQLPGNAA